MSVLFVCLYCSVATMLLQVVDGSTVLTQGLEELLGYLTVLGYDIPLLVEKVRSIG